MKITKSQLRRIIREQSNQPVDPRKMRDMGYNDAMAGKYMDPKYENQIDYKMGFNEALDDIDNDSSAGSMYEGNKITRNQLRRIIREAMGGSPESIGATTHSLVGALKKGGMGAERHPTIDDEIYIMTGEAEGITIKVLRRGR